MRASASPLVPVHKLEAVKAGGGKEKANFFFFLKKRFLYTACFCHGMLLMHRFKTRLGKYS